MQRLCRVAHALVQYIDRDGSIVAAASSGVNAGLSPAHILRGWQGVPCWSVSVTHSMVSMGAIEEQQAAIAEDDHDGANTVSNPEAHEMSEPRDGKECTAVCQCTAVERFMVVL